jgi:hypothetical protein
MKQIKKQKGLVLIAILLFAVLAGLTFFLKKLNHNRTAQNQIKTAEVLAEAKEALLGFAASEYESSYIYGGLPCPDLGGVADDEGLSTEPCGGDYQNSIGRLPWRTLGLAPLRDGSNECLWYAVSGTYKLNPRALLVNEDTAGSLVVPDFSDRVVAVIFAPHGRLGNQSRHQGTARICGGNYVVSNYLESDNASVSTKNFIFNSTNPDNNGVERVLNNSPYSEPSNDSITFITQDELFGLIRRRSDFKQNMKCLTQVITECIAQYGRDNGRLVWPAPLALGDYREDSNYDDDKTVVNLGRLPNTLDDSNNKMGITSPESLLLGTDRCNIESLVLTECNATIKPSDANFILKLQRLWQHWKDHLFYVVSEPFKPDAVLVPPATDPTCAGNCITVDNTDDSIANGNPFAAMVLFAGKASGNQQRDIYPDNTTRDLAINYVSPNNSDSASDADGVGVYNTVSEPDGFMMCIGNSPAYVVGECL